MANTARLYRIEALIRARGCVSFATLMEELEVSRATLKRDLEYLRSRLGAPIEYDRDANGYRFGTAYAGPKHELPGLWFDEGELYSLLMAQQLLAGLEGQGGEAGVLGRHLQPLLERIRTLLASTGGQSGGGSAEALMQRVKVVGAQRRAVPSRHFERVSVALLSRRRLRLRYLTRTRRELGERAVSPQRLVHYRNAWYLDAWCHRVEALRRFALDAVEEVAVLDTAARELPLAEVAEAMDAGYGIFAGRTPRWAVLRFDPGAAQWARREEWHPRQEGRMLADGRFELRLPYVDDDELVRDLLRHGDEVQVLKPASLAKALVERLERALARHRGSAAT
jgi:predicted DNA-binding transcriptional regulator YafY